MFTRITCLRTLRRTTCDEKTPSGAECLVSTDDVSTVALPVALLSPYEEANIWGGSGWAILLKEREWHLWQASEGWGRRQVERKMNVLHLSVKLTKPLSASSLGELRTSGGIKNLSATSDVALIWEENGSNSGYWKDKYSGSRQCLWNVILWRRKIKKVKA